VLIPAIIAGLLHEFAEQGILRVPRRVDRRGIFFCNIR